MAPDGLSGITTREMSEIQLLAVTTVLLAPAPIDLSLPFGPPDATSDEAGRALALFGPGRVVAYLARQPPVRALYLFKTGTQSSAPNRLRHVSRPVKLLYVAATRRTATKATTALKVLRKQVGDEGVDGLPNLFWLPLADFIERRGRSIARQAAPLLDAQWLP